MRLHVLVNCEPSLFKLNWNLLERLIQVIFAESLEYVSLKVNIPIVDNDKVLELPYLVHNNPPTICAL